MELELSPETALQSVEISADHAAGVMVYQFTTKAGNTHVVCMRRDLTPAFIEKVRGVYATFPKH